ncbi:hypothetical protein IPO96_00765 [Candidatus Saccharibacteria bacterium]|nr:MAG: hypothetical protein IPO96_00765 [Candidatus Saccharibacteria bacterium]
MQPTQPHYNREDYGFWSFLRRGVIIVLLMIIVFLLSLLAFYFASKKNSSLNVGYQKASVNGYLSDDGKSLGFAGQTLTINPNLQLNGPITILPQSLPANAKPGTLVFDSATSTLQYYDGSKFVQLPTTEANNQQTAAPTVAGVTSLQGQTGAVSLVPGAGIAINGTTISSSGLLGVNGTAGDINVSTANGIASISLPQSLNPTAVPTFSGVNLSNALAVGSGGTGATSLTPNGVLLGNGSSPVTTASTATAGLCLLSTAGAPAFGVCPGGVGAGVTSLNGLAGNLAVADSSASGSTITINDASTSAKGIAQFNGINFTVAAGVANTVQNIDTSASPTFSGLILSTALSVSSGGTGLTSITNNGVVIGGGAGALQTASAASAGQCLVSTSGAPIFTTCPGANGVASINGASGALTLSNATVSSGVITINSASNTTTGLLTSTDWVTFNSKENPLTFTGNGLFSRSGDTVSGLSCSSNGEAPVWNGVAFACAVPVGTTYSAGQGLSLVGTTFNLAQQGASSGEVLKWNGTGWVPSTDTDTTYTAGTGINISGGNVISSTLGTSIESSEITDGEVSSADIANGTITFADIASNSCNNGEVIKFNGTAWYCGTDADSDTVLTEAQVEAYIFDADNTGTLSSGTLALGSLSYTGQLTDTNISDALTISSSGSVADGALSANVTKLGQTIESSEITDGTVIGTDIASSTILFSNIAQNGCSTNDIMKWNGSAWACATDATGGGAGNSFETIAVSNGTNPVADSSTDTLTLSDGAGITITGNGTTDTLTIAATLGTSIDSSEIVDGTIVAADIADATITNAKLVNSGITVTAGTGLTGGGTVSLGGTVTLTLLNDFGSSIDSSEITNGTSYWY